MPSNKISRKDAGILALVAAFNLSIYLLASHLKFRIGFPLDDAWIHQTYARNFAAWGQWVFWEGQTSGGSTAPLWSAFLALGYWLKISFYVWAFVLGGVLLWGIALLGERFLRKTVSAYRPELPWAGIFLLGEWHLLWASLSGMETLLYALLVAAVLVFLAEGKRNYFLFGALIGISIWVRPGGVTLLGPVVVVILLSGKMFKKILRDLFNLFLSFGIFLALYLFFNLAITGTPYPNTFYAKQAEYASLQLAPLWARFFGEAQLPLIGAGALLLPAALYFGWHALRRRDVGTLVGGLWFLGYAALYAWKLPVTYQHGRYMIPAMPIYFFWGLSGLSRLLADSHCVHWKKLGAFAWRSALILVWFAFYGLGAKSYAEDVAFIESEMVTTAHWVAENLPPDALIAAHDIGALGYFDGRELVDLAGLVSPDVISILRDEEELTLYLNDQEVDYLIVFPSWYETLSEGLPLVYNTDSPFALLMNGENMSVYQWVR
ncbi:MAG: hypothetical protein DRI32_00730 [Chloroflexi bacterium]|nr:MAG: hypothetical protein DRI32_00730 [Chloroflexota bacterium]